MSTNISFSVPGVRFLRSISAVLSIVGLLVLPGYARAQAPTATPVPGVAPPPAAPQPAPVTGAPPSPWDAPPSAYAPNGEYVAPLSQTTQPSYVPQSVALSGPRMIRDWHDGDPIPWGYHREERVRKGEVISGAIVFGVLYLYSGFIAAIGEDVSPGNNRAAALYIPVLGPFIELHQSSSATLNYLLVLDGLAQGVGAGMFLHGLSSPRAVLVRNNLAMVTLTPAQFGKDGAGVMMLGRF